MKFMSIYDTFIEDISLRMYDPYHQLLTVLLFHLISLPLLSIS